MQSNARIVGLLILGLFTVTLHAAELEFPGRKDYPDIPYIEIGELYKIRSKVVIVDTRSRYEYDTLRIKQAVNLPVSNDNFSEQVRKIAEESKKTLVFYCNGHRCMKSYIAAKKSIAAGVLDVLAFDAGIFDWTKRYPDQAELLGQSPVTANKLIASQHFESKLLHPDAFSERIANYRDQSIVIDVRDKFQRSGVGFYPGIERWAELDDRKKLSQFIEKAKRENKTLFFYDEVGSQVQWLQYSLEQAGVKNYYFMQHGARAYYDMLAKMEWQ